MIERFRRRSVLHWFGTICLFIGASSAPVMSQDAQLYDDPPPNDAAYVRFFGFPEEAEVEIFGMVFSGDRLTSGSYSILRGDSVDGIAPGDILTIVPDANGAPVLLQEPARSDRKVLLRLVNLDPENPVALFTEDGAVEIIADTAWAEIGAREVNPIQISVVVSRNGAVDGPAIPLILRRDEHVTIVALPTGKALVVTDSAIPDPLE